MIVRGRGELDAQALTQRLGGTWLRNYGTAPCPVCQPERRKDQNALTLADGQSGFLLHCKKSNCGFRDVLIEAGILPGSVMLPDPVHAARPKAERKAEVAKREQQAHMLWGEAQLIGDTIAEAYLRHRGITCGLPGTLRFHPHCWHGATASRHPALVALIQGSDGFATHRTYLRRDGRGKAKLEPAKAMLGSVAGGAVRLRGDRGPLVVAEGIETALSLASGLLRGPATVWAALSTSGIRGLRLPPVPGDLIIAADGDEAGRAAAQALAERADASGWSVSLLTAPEGCDWNDVINLEGTGA